jgi:hypothetical protein
VFSAAVMLVAASSAFGAPDPLKGGTTTLGPLKLPGKVKVKVKGGATKSGKTLTLPIIGGTLDPLHGTGPVQDGGTIVLKKGKKQIKLTGIVTAFGTGGKITARTSSPYAQGKKKSKSFKIASIVGGTIGRAGFGGTVTDAVAKLTKKGAGKLNTALGIRKGGFKGGRLGLISTSTIPATVTVKSADSNTVEYAGDIFIDNCVPSGTCSTYAGKLAEDGVTATAIPPASIILIYVQFSPQTGGSIAPDCSDGTLTGSQGGVKLEMSGASITQANPEDAFGTHSVTFEASTPAQSLGRAAATNLIVTPGTCNADPTTRTITVSAIQTVNANAASIANQVLGLTGTPCGPGGPPQNCPLAGGDPVGTTSYTIHTQ